MAILGAGAATTVVGGSTTRPIFTVNGAASVVLLSRLTLTNGQGRIRLGRRHPDNSAGDLIVTGSRLIGNAALSGGAISQQSPGS